MDFSVYATWTFDKPVPADQRGDLGDAVDRLPGATCVYVDEVDETVLHATFDLTADDYAAALSTALNASRSTAAAAGLRAHLSEVVAMTEEAQLRWAPPPAFR